jgi:hypothetical protein
LGLFFFALFCDSDYGAGLGEYNNREDDYAGYTGNDYLADDPDVPRYDEFGDFNDTDVNGDDDTFHNTY